MNMDFEKLLEQEARKAARQDYEEVTEKTKDYSYKYSKAFIQKMNAMIHEEKRKDDGIFCWWQRLF